MQLAGWTQRHPETLCDSVLLTQAGSTLPVFHCGPCALLLGCPAVCSPVQMTRRQMWESEREETREEQAPKQEGLEGAPRP